MRFLRRQAAAALTAALLAPAAPAEVWQWTDSEGVVRYTPNPDRVPQSERGSLIKLEPGMPVPAKSPAGPPVRYAPPEELPRGADPFATPEPARTLEAPETEPRAALEEPEAGNTAVPEGLAATPPATPEHPEAERAPRVAPAEVSVPGATASEPPAPQAPPGHEPEPPAANRPLSEAEQARRAQLKAQIAADQEALKQLLSRQAREGDSPLRESPELREIARRLPVLQAELRALEGVPSRRDERSAPTP